MNIIRKKIVAAVFLLLCVQFGCAQDVMTVDKAIEIILKNNFSIFVARDATEIAKNYNIVQQQELLKALNEEIAVSEERAKIADRKFSNGSGSKLDLLQAKVDLNAQRSALMKQQTALEESKVSMNQLLAQPLDTKFNV